MLMDAYRQNPTDPCEIEHLSPSIDNQHMTELPALILGKCYPDTNRSVVTSDTSQDLRDQTEPAAFNKPALRMFESV